MSLQINNIVFTSSLNMSLNMESLKSTFIDCRYEPKSFNGAIIKFGKRTILLFRNGKFVSTGNKSHSDASKSVDELFEGLKLEESLKEKIVFSCRNISCSTTFGEKLNIPKLVRKFGKSAHYEPELFPTMVVEHPTTNIKCLIFHTGKIIVTGGKSLESINDFTNEIIEKIKLFNEE